MNDEKDSVEKALVHASTADILSVLSNPIRLEILASIAKAEKCVSEIADALELDASSVSHSLGLLSDKDLVKHTPLKKQRIYRLSDAVIASVDGTKVCFDVTTMSGEQLSFETHLP